MAATEKNLIGTTPIVRGRFASESLEQAFQEHFRRAHWFQNTVAATAGLFLYSLFGLVDRVALPDAWEHLWQIRFEVTFPLLVVTLGFQFIPAIGRRHSGPLIFLAMLQAGSSIVVMNLSMPHGLENLYFYGLLLVIIFGHVFWRAYYLWPAAASAILFIFYLVITLRFGSVSVANLVAATFYYVSAFVILTYAGWFFDRQERRSFYLQQELQQVATTDALTGIANRRAFFTHLGEEWRRGVREGATLCLLVVDLDDMKGINDTGGHARGDQALKEVAEVLDSHARRPGDLAARLGGDEFVLLLAGGDSAAACRMGEEIVAHMAQGASGATVSVGIACEVPDLDGSYEKLMKEADQALYEAKRQGRSKAVCHCRSGEAGAVASPQISA